MTWWTDKRDEMRRMLRELELEVEWEELKKEEKELQEKGKKENEWKRVSELEKWGKRIAAAGRRREGRDYELASKRLAVMSSKYT